MKNKMKPIKLTKTKSVTAWVVTIIIATAATVAITIMGGKQ